MEFFKDLYAKAHKSSNNVVNLLKKRLSGYRPARGYGTIHASEVTKSDFCARRVALSDVTGLKPKDQYLSTALAATFDLGNVVADVVKESWLDGAAVGNWKCNTCKAERTFTKKPPACTSGQNCAWKYVEMCFVSNTYGVSGAVDVLVDLGEEKLVVYELKIMAADEFDKIKAPLAEHRIRTVLYLYLISDSSVVYKSHINTEKAGVLYVSRGYGRKNEEHDEILPFKEFFEDSNLLTIKPALENALKVKQWRDHKRMPRGICAQQDCKIAQKCHVSTACFSGKFPADG